MRRWWSAERGVGIPTVMMVMGLMLTLGFGSYAYVDGQQEASGTDRKGESSFNLSEGLMSTQSYILSSNWPGSLANAYPAQCALADGSAAANPSHCPQPAKVAESFTSPDYRSGLAWATAIRDDVSGSYYDKAAVENASRWDANGNKQIWVRSSSNVGPRRRTLVALIQVERLNEVLPERVIIAGKFATGNAGNKVIVDAGGSGNAVTVRCTPPGPGRNACLDYDDAKGQVSPPGAVAHGQMVGEPALPPETVARLESRARSDGTYFPTGQCPTTLTGAVIFVESADCSYQGGSYNSATSPGIVIFRQGTLTLKGNFTFYGVVYMLNEPPSTSQYPFTVAGAGTLRGAVYVDGEGGVWAGSDKFNIVYDTAAVTNIASYGTAGVVQNTWREVPSG